MPIRFSVRFVLRSGLALFALAAVAAVPHQSSAQSTATIVVSNQNSGQWEHDLQADLIAEKFDTLDTTADHLRSEKTRLPGGQWQLRLFYSALDAPQQSEQDSVEHITHLEHWMTQRPNSITARVALATALTRWAWVARGHGYADTITPEGGRLFEERMKEAHVILEGSQKMPVLCPQWYSAMMAVGVAQNWEFDRLHKILDDGVKLEPGYYYLYMQYANYLLPKWHGADGEASKFAATSADALGGDAGDILYFQIATSLIKRGDGDFSVHEMDWPRLQHGYQALLSQYGSAHFPENQLAYMAWKFQDPAVARQQFALIGDAWNRSVWGDREEFDRARDWAQSPTPALLPGQGQLKPFAIH
jgi:hypothetical protein